MKKSIFYIIILGFLANSLGAQDLISIEGVSPYPAGTKVFFEGYDGFNKIDLGSIRTTAEGGINYFFEFHGYCTMSSDNEPSYPVIMEYDPVCIEWDKEEKFTCEPENEYFYQMLPGLNTLDTLIENYISTTDSAQKILHGQQLKLSFDEFETLLANAPEVNARVILQAELLLRKAEAVDSVEMMAKLKEDIMALSVNEIDILRRSDLLMRMSEAYFEMNYKLMAERAGLSLALLYDVDTWVNSLGPILGERGMLEFFLLYFATAQQQDVIAGILEKYIDKVSCEQYVSNNLRPANMPYTFSVFGGPDFSRVYNLDQFYGMPKVLALYSTDCPASVAAIAALYVFMTEKQLRIPVILVPGNEPEGELAELLTEKAPFGMQAGVKTGNSLIFAGGVKQLPAFMMLDRNNLREDVIYDYKILQKHLSGEE